MSLEEIWLLMAATHHNALLARNVQRVVLIKSCDPVDKHEMHDILDWPSTRTRDNPETGALIKL